MSGSPLLIRTGWSIWEQGNPLVKAALVCLTLLVPVLWFPLGPCVSLAFSTCLFLLAFAYAPMGLLQKP